MNKKIVEEHINSIAYDIECRSDIDTSIGLDKVKECINSGCDFFEAQVAKKETTGTKEDVKALKKIAKKAFEKISTKDFYINDFTGEAQVSFERAGKRLKKEFKKYLKKIENKTADSITLDGLNETLLAQYVDSMTKELNKNIKKHIDNGDKKITFDEIKGITDKYYNHLKQEIKAGNVNGTKQDIEALKEIIDKVFNEIYAYGRNTHVYANILEEYIRNREEAIVEKETNIIDSKHCVENSEGITEYTLLYCINRIVKYINTELFDIDVTNDNNKITYGIRFVRDHLCWIETGKGDRYYPSANKRDIEAFDEICKNAYKELKTKDTVKLLDPNGNETGKFKIKDKKIIPFRFKKELVKYLRESKEKAKSCKEKAKCVKTVEQKVSALVKEDEVER